MIGDERPLAEEAEIILRIPEAGVALMSSREVAHLLRIPEDTLLHWAATGEGPPFYSWAKTPFYLREEVAVWLTDPYRYQHMIEPNRQAAR